MASNQAFSANPADYEVAEKIGQGAFGSVCVVQDTDGNEYVLKEIDLSKMEKDSTPEAKAKTQAMALNEVMAIKSLADNKNLVRIYDYFEGGDILYVSMEHCSEGSLKDALDIIREQDEWFKEDLLVTWFVQLVSVLKFVHNKHILHRNIQPANIFLAQGGRTVKLGGFGIVQWCCTLSYLPPELFIGHTYTAKSEVWALGIVMYELMSRKLPDRWLFKGSINGAVLSPDPIELLPPAKYSEEFRDYLVSKMLCKKHDKRPTFADVLGSSFFQKCIANMGHYPLLSSPFSCSLDLSVPRSFNFDQTNAATARNISRILQGSETGDIALLLQALATIPLEKLLDPETWQKSTLNRRAETPLHLAAEQNQILMMELLWPVMGKQLALATDVEGHTPIGRAAMSNACAAVEFVLRKDSSQVDIRDGRWGRNVLHHVAAIGYVELCQKLVIQYQADVFARSNNEDAESLPIHLAASGGHLPVVKYFVQAKPELELQQNSEGNLSIHCAAIGGHIDVVELFLEERGQSVDVRGSKGKTSLHHAARYGHVELCINLVCRFGADVFAKSEETEFMSIHLAAYFGHLPVVNYLLEVNPDLLVQKVGGSGEFSIHLAARMGHIDVVEYFLREKKQSVEIRGCDGRTVLHHAAANGHVTLCKMLVRTYNADLFAKSLDTDRKKMPIHLAAQGGFLGVVKYLLEVAPELELARDSKGNQPVHCAAIEGRIDMVDFFLKERNLPVETPGFNGRTVLHMAAEIGNVELCDRLVNHYGADVFAKSNAQDDVYTPIHIAAYFGHLSVVVFFVKHNPELIIAQNYNGKTPLQLAQSEAEEDVAAYLKSVSDKMFSC